MSRGITHPCILLLSYTYTHDSIKTFSERKLNSWSKYKSLGFIKRSRETQTTHILRQIQPINPLKFPHNSQFRSFFLFSSFSRRYRTRESWNQSRCSGIYVQTPHPDPVYPDIYISSNRLRSIPAIDVCAPDDLHAIGHIDGISQPV